VRVGDLWASSRKKYLPSATHERNYLTSTLCRIVSNGDFVISDIEPSGCISSWLYLNLAADKRLVSTGSFPRRDASHC